MSKCAVIYISPYLQFKVSFIKLLLYDYFDWQLDNSKTNCQNSENSTDNNMSKKGLCHSWLDKIVVYVCDYTCMDAWLEDSAVIQFSLNTLLYQLNLSFT